MGKKYKLRKGIVMTTVCGETLLVATAEAREDCPFTVRLNEASVYLLSLLETELSEEERAAKIAEHCGISLQKATSDMAGFMNTMLNDYRVIVEDL